MVFTYFFHSNYTTCLSVTIIIPNIFETRKEGINKIAFFIYNQQQGKGSSLRDLISSRIFFIHVPLYLAPPPNPLPHTFGRFLEDYSSINVSFKRYINEF